MVYRHYSYAGSLSVQSSIGRLKTILVEKLIFGKIGLEADLFIIFDCSSLTTLEHSGHVKLFA